MEIIYNIEVLERISAAMDAWDKKNFGGILPRENSRPWGMLWTLGGIAEEIAELIDATDQTVRKFCTIDKEKGLDAVADICMYSMNFLRKAKIGLAESLSYTKKPIEWENKVLLWVDNGVCQKSCLPLICTGLAYCSGKLGHHVVGVLTKTRMQENHWDQVKFWTCHLWRLCYLAANFIDNKIDFTDLLDHVSAVVMNRDWKKFPDDANKRVLNDTISKCS